MQIALSANLPVRAGRDAVHLSFEARRRLVSGLMRAHERILRRSTFSLARELTRTQWLAPEALAAMQAAKLRRLVEHARVHSGFWSRRLAAADAKTEGGLDLSSFPFLLRDELREHAEEMCCGPRRGRGRVLHHQTRGTQGQSVTFFWDRRRQAWDKANRIRGHGWHGLRIGDRELHLWPLDPPRGIRGRALQRLRERRDAILGDLLVDCLAASGERAWKTCQTWRRFDPHCVTAYPSMLVELIDHAKRRGLSLCTPSLQTVFLTGEPTLAWQRRRIESELGAVTVQDYGVQEVGALAYECELGSWHVTAESAIVEFIRGERPAREGELAEVVVTGLESGAMPVIRYRTGDIVRLERRECPCGRGLPVMPPVQGRTEHFLRSADGSWIEPRTVCETLNALLRPGTWQVRQAANGTLELTIQDNVAQPKGGTDRAGAALRRLMGAGSDQPCRVLARPSLQRTEFGKCRYVASRSGPGGPAVI